MKLNQFISVILINEEYKITKEYLVILSDYLELNFTDHEIIIVNRRTENIDNLQNILNEIKYLRYLKVSISPDKKNYDEIQYLVGLENSVGDFVITLRPYIDPFDKILFFIKRCMEGYDIIVGKSTNVKNSLFYKLTKDILRNSINKITKINLNKNITWFRCFSRRSIIALFNSTNKFTRIDTRIPLLDFKVDYFSYSEIDYSVKTKKTFITEFNRGFDLLVFSSSRPLRFANYIGLFGSIFAMLLALYSLLSKIFFQNTEPGWTSLFFMTSLFFSIIFVILFLLTEYLFKVLEDKGASSLYSVISEQYSSVIENNNRTNVFQESQEVIKNLVQTARNK